MRRRDVLAGIAAVVAGTLPGRRLHAQVPPKMLRVGTVVTRPRTTAFWVSFEQRMRELGYVEGENLAIEFVETYGRFDRYVDEMKELVRRKVDIIVASGTEISLRSALEVTGTLPIVMVAVDYDPLALGYITSLARPSGNVTGVSFEQIELSVKRLQLMKDAFPDMRAPTVFWDAISAHQWQATQRAGATLGVQLTGIEFHEQPYDYEQALAQAPPDHRGTLIVMTSPVFALDRERLPAFALRHRLASMFAARSWAEAGGLMAYGPSITAMYRRAAEYVDRIARGAKPSDLPIEQPTKFELLVNLRTARAIGVTIPPSILLRADEVIE